jgi:GntR family transcriptional regulator/MocR family aminotransferase
LRHLRRLKRAYGAKREELLAQLRSYFDASHVTAAGLAVLLQLPDATSDVAIADALRPFGISPSPLSLWYASAETARSGLLLGVATSPTKGLANACERVAKVIRRLS